MVLDSVHAKQLSRKSGVALKGHCESQHQNRLFPECAACCELLEQCKRYHDPFDLSYYGITVRSLPQMPQKSPLTTLKRTTPEYLVKLRTKIRRDQRILKQRYPKIS